MEMQLLNLGFRFASIRSSHSQEERAASIKAFNENPDVQILTFNTKLGSQSLNLHHAAFRVIVMEVPLNVPTFIQVVGRVARIGQTRPQEIYLLWANHTYDQVRLNRMADKFVPTIAGEGTGFDAMDNATEQAEELMRRFMGLQHSVYPRAWGNADFEAKDRFLAGEDKPGSLSSPGVGVSNTLGKIGKGRRLDNTGTNILKGKSPIHRP